VVVKVKNGGRFRYCLTGIVQIYQTFFNNEAKKMEEKGKKVRCLTQRMLDVEVKTSHDFE